MSVSKAYTGKGTVLGIATIAAPTVFTTVAELKTFSFSGTKNDTEDVTNSDSTGRAHEFIVTLLDSGEISIAGNYVGGDVGQIAFRAAFNAGSVVPFKMTLPVGPGQTTSGDVFAFIGAVVENALSVEYNKANSFSAKVKISGVISYTAGT